MIKQATFTSVWEGGISATSNCKVNTETKEVFDIESIDVDGVDSLEEQYIYLDGEFAYVYEKDDYEDEGYWYDSDSETTGIVTELENHYGADVHTNINTDPIRRSECMCLFCEKLKPGKPDNCPAAQTMYETSVKYDCAMMMTRCKMFVAGKYFDGRKSKEGKNDE